MNTNRISGEITVFHDQIAPEKGLLVDYGAIIVKCSKRHYVDGADQGEWLIVIGRLYIGYSKTIR